MASNYCSNCGSPLPLGARFCGQCGHPVSPPPVAPVASPGTPPPARSGLPAPRTQPPPQGATAPPGGRRKSRRGCLLGCAAALLILALLAGGGLLWPRILPPRSDNLAPGKRQAVVSQTIGPSGGTLAVHDPASPINGLTIAVPAGAYAGETRFSVSILSIAGHQLGPNFNPITPLIRVDTRCSASPGPCFAAEPMTVEIPIQIADGEFAMAFLYDLQSGKLEGLPPIALSPGRLTLATSHFSDIVVSKVDPARLQQIAIDTGFRPGVDDWQFTNNGSVIAPRGHCAGQSISAMWYYYEKRLRANEPPLYARFDNNDDDPQTPELWLDDSWGYRLASAVQVSIDWDVHSRKLFKYLGGVDDRLTWYAFVYAMALTGEPQYVAIGQYTPDAQGNLVRSGHAIIAYRIENGQIYVADPNYPGQAGRRVRFQNGAFLPYPSGANAIDIANAGPTDYTEIRYMAKSALVDWERVGTLYEAMLEGKAGQGLFPGYGLSVATGRDQEGEVVWTAFPDVLEMDEAQTAEIGEAFRGKLVFRVTTDAGDDHFRVVVYDGSSAAGTQYPQSGQVEAWYRLQPGPNRVGFLIETTDADGNLNYNDFWRIKVFYGRPDLTGAWSGTFRINEAANAGRYVEEGVVRFLLLVGLAQDEQQAREMARAAVVEAPGLRQERPLGVLFEPPQAGTPDQYPARVLMVGDDGEQREYAGKAVYEKGQVQFSARAGDGSTFHFGGELVGQDRLAGTFTITAWGVVKDAGSGTWQLARQKP